MFELLGIVISSVIGPFYSRKHFFKKVYLLILLCNFKNKKVIRLYIYIYIYIHTFRCIFREDYRWIKANQKRNHWLHFRECPRSEWRFHSCSHDVSIRFVFWRRLWIMDWEDFFLVWLLWDWLCTHTWWKMVIIV